MKNKNSILVQYEVQSVVGSNELLETCMHSKILIKCSKHTQPNNVVCSTSPLTFHFSATPSTSFQHSITMSWEAIQNKQLWLLATWLYMTFRKPRTMVQCLMLWSNRVSQGWACLLSTVSKQQSRHQRASTKSGQTSHTVNIARTQSCEHDGVAPLNTGECLSRYRPKCAQSASEAAAR